MFLKQFSFRKRGANNSIATLQDQCPVPDGNDDGSPSRNTASHALENSGGAVAGSSTLRAAREESMDIVDSDIRDPLGLKVIYTPPSERRVDIIFIHGLGGSSRKTWTRNKDPKTFWPSYFLPQETDIRDARIFSFGYNANFRAGSGKTRLSILDFSNDLLYDLKFAHDDTQVPAAELRMGEKPIIFVVHSMGGLLVKEAYIQGQNDPMYRNIIDAITSIIFLATPHRGTHLAETLNRILRVSLVSSPTYFISELVAGSHTLQRLNEQFRHVAPKLRIVSFYETRPTTIFKKTRTQVMILEKESSVLGYPGEISKPLDADHREVCKFGSRDDPNYVAVRNALRASVQAAKLTRAHIRFPLTTSSEDFRSYLGIKDSPGNDLNFFRDQWTKGTSSWLLNHETFKSWANTRDGSPHLLWIHGKAGSGKSVLTSIIIERLTQMNLLCAYFFVRYSDHKKQSWSFLLRSIAFQIATKLPAYAATVRELELTGVDIETMHFRTVWQLLFKDPLMQLIQEQPLFVVIDGIDEADNPPELLRLFEELRTTEWSLRLLMVSRETPDISLSWERLGHSLHTRSISMNENHDDFRQYIDQVMNLADDQISQTVENRLLESARGNFLWLNLAVQRVNKSYTTGDIDQALTELLPGMGNLYDRMREKVEAQARSIDHNLGIEIIGCVACVQRLLSLEELKDILGYTGIVEVGKVIRDLSGGFIVIDAERMVSLTHETARGYLLHASSGPESLSFIDEHSTNFAIFKQTVSCLTDHALRGLLLKGTPPTLLRYASSYWFIHLSHCTLEDSPALDIAIGFLKSSHILTWITILARAQELATLISASNYLKGVSKRLRRAGHHDQLESQEAITTIDAWATDLANIVGKFGDRLLSYPDSIFKLVPPFCPKSSITYQLFGQKEDKTLRVNFPNDELWDDCLMRFTIDKGYIASVIVTAGSCVAVLATMRNVSQVSLYNSQTFERQRLIVHPERVLNIHLDNRARTLVSYGYLTTRIWNISTGQCLRILQNPRRRPLPHTMVFLQLQERVLVGGNDRCIRYCSFESSDDDGWTDVARIQEQRLDDTILNFPVCSALSSDGTMIIYGYRSYPMTAWKLEPLILIGQCRFELKPEDKTLEDYTLGEVFRVAWHPQSDNCEVFGLTQVGLLFKWFLYEDFPTVTVNTASQTLAVSGDGVFVATGDALGTIKLFSATDLSLLYQLGSQDPVTGLTFSQDSKQLYDTRGSYGNVWQPHALTNTDDSTGDPNQDHNVGREAKSFTSMHAPQKVQSLRVDTVISLAGQASGSLYCYGTEEGVVVLGDARHGVIMDLERAQGWMPIEQISWSEKGDLVCTAQLGGKVSIHELSQRGGPGSPVEVTLHTELQLPSDHGYVTQLIFHHTRKHLLISTPTTLFLLDYVSLELRQTHLAEDVEVRWMLHPAAPDHIIGFGIMNIYVYDFWSLQQLESKTRVYFPPPTIDHTSPFLGNDGSNKGGGTPGENQMLLGKLILPGSDSSNIVLQLCLSERNVPIKTIHLVFDTEELVRFCKTSVSTCTGDEGDTRKVSYTLLPPELETKMREPLAILSGRLVFLTRERWVCTWKMPSTTVRAGRTLMRGGGFRKVSGTASGFVHGDIEGVEAHYFLPGDWVTDDEARLCAVTRDGTLLCPRNGYVATVHYARLRR